MTKPKRQKAAWNGEVQVIPGTPARPDLKFCQAMQDAIERAKFQPKMIALHGKVR